VLQGFVFFLERRFAPTKELPSQFFSQPQCWMAMRGRGSLADFKGCWLTPHPPPIPIPFPLSKSLPPITNGWFRSGGGGYPQNPPDAPFSQPKAEKKKAKEHIRGVTPTPKIAGHRPPPPERGRPPQRHLLLYLRKVPPLLVKPSHWEGTHRQSGNPRRSTKLVPKNAVCLPGGGWTTVGVRVRGRGKGC